MAEFTVEPNVDPKPLLGAVVAVVLDNPKLLLGAVVDEVDEPKTDGADVVAKPLPVVTAVGVDDPNTEDVDVCADPPKIEAEVVGVDF